ncbi:HIT family protein [Candidatus Vallotiella sp. (ex Adelges kitamiensis)]|uniref:HIT family protein n=1 Tax=Candidatus Vallotiella sp. (ex Adelges kitamiensis) TaxID=2864217 RepID=UPI001CE2B28B|nr:HIT family protein [Candidatus Vallotia sp. (ex Adelges kitamiensis)]
MCYINNNLFAKILRGELTCVKVAETENVLAFMDLMPEADGHVLIVPKEAVSEIFDLSDAAGAACFWMIRRVATAMRAALKPEGMMVVQFNGTVAGQTVPHVHFHVIPRRVGEKLKSHTREIAELKKLEVIAELIRAQLKLSG